MHPSLARQLRRSGVVDPAVPPGPTAWSAFLDRVDGTYTDADQQRYLVERSLALSAREMQSLHAALADERDTLQALLRAMGDALCALDAHGRVLFANPAAERLLGWAEAELRGVDLVAAWSLGEGCATLDDLVGSGRPYRQEDGSVHRKDGTRVPVAYGLDPIMRDGTLSGAVLVVRDISERKRAEAERARLAHAQAARARAEQEAAEHRRSEQVLATLQAVSAEVAAALDPTELAELVVRELQERFGYELPSIYFLEPDGCLHLAAQRGYATPVEQFAPGAGVIGRVAHTLRPALVVDPDVDPDFVPMLPGVVAQAGVPICVGEVLHGVINVEARDTGLLHERDLALLEALARMVAAALENARLFRAAQSAAAERERIAAELRAQQALVQAQQHSEERFRALVQNASDVIVILDAAGRVGYLSPAAERAWGYLPAAVQGGDVLALVHPDDEAAARAQLARALQQPEATIAAELRLRHANGSWRDCEVLAINLLHQPAIQGIVATYHDVTDRKTFERELKELAFSDRLTGLANRALFQDRLEHALARADRQGRSIAVLFLDLDHFKVVNDSLGHSSGDALLAEVAGRLRSCLRTEDTAARLGGDEFAVLLEDIGEEADAIAVAARITAQLRAPVALGDRHVVAGASIGVALSVPGRDRPDSLLRNADLALYRAKANGRARYEVFDASLEARALERLELEADLRQALERGELRVYYQPILSLEDGHVAEIEALVRWAHPRRGLVTPDRFIPLAEETGLIVPIGQWVLEEACRQTREWQVAHATEPPLLVSVNLSARQFQQPDLLADVERALRTAGLAPESLKLEITESVLMQHPERAAATMRALKELGVRLAVDDFGTGYSSLAYLKRFPVDTLKIDRTFVGGLGQDEQDAAIVRSVVTLARSLGMSVTGEGIETEAQRAYLRLLGCEQGQGYLFARPLPAEAIAPLFSDVARLVQAA